MHRVLIIVSVVLLGVWSECPQCDPNDYNPVCVEQKAFISLCHLERLQCLGKITLPTDTITPCKDVLIEDKLLEILDSLVQDIKWLFQP